MRAAPNLERRDKARLPHVCPITIKEASSGRIQSGRLFNYSDNGFYFESDALMDPGIEVFIGLRDSPFDDRPSDFSYHRTIIMWRKELAEESHFFYGYGAQIAQASPSPVPATKRNQRRHPRRPFNRKVRFAADNLIAEGLAVDISASGAFVKSGKMLRTGQVITMKIPDKTGKEIVVKGKVVWSSTDGFGLQFVAV
jgi:hypothetical protein